LLKNYIKIAFRNLLKNKGISFINITGLAIALSCAILILLHVQSELWLLSFEPLVIAAFLTLIIALLTVGYQAVKAAVANPVKSLRYE
jgi:ABC-type lipoprotein release transport system permease subunit